jgi:hypothetical protein
MPLLACDENSFILAWIHPFHALFSLASFLIGPRAPISTGTGLGPSDNGSSPERGLLFYLALVLFQLWWLDTACCEHRSMENRYRTGREVALDDRQIGLGGACVQIRFLFRKVNPMSAYGDAQPW